MRTTITAALGALMLAGCGAAIAGKEATTAPTIAAAEPKPLGTRVAGALHLGRERPAMRWGDGHDAWTQATLEALNAEGVTLLSSVPADVMQYCPGYATQSRDNRAAFWAGFLSAVARHESGWNPAARAGAGGKLGLMQISPDTARANGCTGGLLDGADNLQCAVRVMTARIVADGAIHGGSEEGKGERGWRGVARDWLPLRSASKRADIAGWTRRQSYCR